MMTKIKFSLSNFAWCTGAFILLWTMLYRMPYWWCHKLVSFADQSVYLAMAQLLMQGKTPYVDFFDFNPPLIIYLSTAPVALSQLLNLPVTEVFNFCIYAVLFFTTALTAILFYYNRHGKDRFLFFPVMLAPVICTQAQLYDFGQREHLFVLLYFPFFACRYLRYENGTIPRFGALFIAICAATGMALKPQFFLTAILVEVSMCFQFRTLKFLKSIEIIVCALLIFLYLLHFAFYNPQALNILLNQAWPVYANGASFYRIGFIEGLVSQPSFSYPFYLVVIALCAAFALQSSTQWFKPAVVFSLLSMISLLQGGTTWSYRALPLQAGSLILIAMAAGVILQSLWRRTNFDGRKFQAARILFLIACAVTTVCCCPAQTKNSSLRFDMTRIGYEGQCPAGDLWPLTEAILNYSDLQDSVICLGPGVRPGYPSILQARRPPGTRYLHGMLLPMLGVCVSKDKEKFEPMLDQVLANYGADILANKPKLIFIEDYYVAALLKERHFVEEYMTSYTLVRHLEEAHSTLYRRK